MEQKIQDTQFRTVPESLSSDSEDGQQDLQNPIDEEEQHKKMEKKEQRANIWIHLFYGLSIWGEKCHEFAICLAIAYVFPNTLLLAAMVAVASLLMPLLLSGPIATAIDKFPRFPLLATSTCIVKAAMIITYGVLGLLYVKCAQKEEDIEKKEIKQLLEPICIISSLGLIFLAAVHSFSYLLSNASFTKDWLVVIKSVIREHGGDTVFMETNLKRQNIVSKILGPFTVAGSVHIFNNFKDNITFAPPLVITLGLMCVWTLLSGVLEIVLLRQISNLYPELKDNIGIPMMPHDPEENKAQARPINVEEEPPTLVGQILAPWALFGKQKVLLATIGFALFCVSTLIPGPVLTTYLKFRKLQDIEIATFHGAAPLVGMVGSKVIPFIINYVSTKIVFLVTVWLIPIVLLVAVAQVFLVETMPTLTTWMLVAPILFIRANIWGLEFIEFQVIRGYVAAGDVGTVKGVQWMTGNALHVLGYVIALLVCFSANFKFLVVVSVVACFLGTIFYTSWVVIHGKDIGQKVIVEKEEEVDHRQEHTVMDDQDLNMDNAMSDISSESDQ